MKNMFFGKNLKYLRVKKGVKTKDIQDIMNFKPSQWSHYENEKSFPKLLDFIEISSFFQVSETDLLHKDLEKTGVSKAKKAVDDNMLTYLVSLQKEKIASLEFELAQLKKSKQKIEKVNQS